MALTISGTTGLSSPGGDTSSADNTINGVRVGRGAGSVATNTAVGASALAANTSGTVTTAIGYQALTAQTTANWNNSIGYQSSFKTTTGSANNVLGTQALYNNTTGSNNVAVGDSALLSNTTASNNTAVGYQAGYTNSTGTQLTCLGYQAGYASTSNYSTYVGATAGQNSTGSLNTFVGCGGSGYLMTTGSKNTIIGGYTGNNSGLDIRTSNNFIVLSDGDGNPRAYWSDTGNITVPATYNNTTATAANMVVGGSGFYARSTSALKYKQDIRDVEDFDIGLLRPVRYKSKCAGDDQTKDHLGLIADEAAEAGFEELVTRNADGEVEGFQYERLTVVLLKEMQRLKAEIAALKGKA